MEADEIIIEHHEHFIKQTYRNRCEIYSPNGIQALIIPVMHSNLSKSPLKDIKISFDTPWNKIHWKSITSAYRNSPYFEFFEEDFQKVYVKPDKFLIDFNLNLFFLILKLFKINKIISNTVSFVKNPDSITDFRNTFLPKKKYS